jgi:hypothetical protein
MKFALDMNPDGTVSLTVNKRMSTMHQPGEKLSIKLTDSNEEDRVRLTLEVFPLKKDGSNDRNEENYYPHSSKQKDKKLAKHNSR